MREYEIRDMVRRMVREQLMFYRHYWGQVISVDDRLGMGRIQVSLPELRWTDQRNAPWCSPRLGPGISVPRQDSMVEVYFVEGNPGHAVWIGRVPELNEKVKAYTGPKVHVLFEDQATGDAVLYDEDSKEVRILGKGDNLVTYAALAQAVSNLVGVFNAHVHGPGTFTTPSGPVTLLSGGPTSSMSADISGAKAAHLRTDG